MVYRATGLANAGLAEIENLGRVLGLVFDLLHTALGADRWEQRLDAR